MFESILYESLQTRHAAGATQAPDCCKDLHLDQIFARLLGSTDAFDFSPVLYCPLSDAAAVRYRQAILRDLTDRNTHALFLQFANQLHALERNLTAAQKELRGGHSTEDLYLKSCCLESAVDYCDAVCSLASGLEICPLHSGGLLALQQYLKTYCQSPAFQAMQTEIRRLKAAFSQMHLCLKIKEGTLHVRPYEEQQALNDSITALFSRFQQKDAPAHPREHPRDSTLPRMDAQLLAMAAHWYKDDFAALDAFVQQYPNFMDSVLVRCSREVHFYLAWLDYIAPLEALGLPFCYPEICADATQLHCDNGFDLALAKVLSPQGKIPVVNDFSLRAPEQILVITGPNQGGKTTFARAYGQLFYLASLGLCVPGSSAAVCLFDHIYTHFNQEETFSARNGQLQDELLRLHGILEQATGHSILIVNEIFSSTTFQDALLLGRKMMEQIIGLGCPAVCVTFLDELAALDAHTVSMMSMVNPDDPTVRTYKVQRKDADGLAYAAHIAQKYHLTYQDLTRRLQK